MGFEYLGNPYAENRQMQLSERLGAQNMAASQQEMGMKDEKIKQAKIERYVSMVTPETWGAVRQRAISEGLAGEQEIPVAYDANWVSQVKSALSSTSSQLPTSAIQNYNHLLSLPTKEERDSFSNVLGASQVINTGGQNIVRDRLGNVTDTFTNTMTPAQVVEADLKKQENERKNKENEITQRTEKERLAKVEDVRTQAVTIADRLLKNIEGVKANRGGVSTLFPNVSNASVDAEADLESLASLLTTENLGLLKGVLSDTDMKVLRDIGASGLKGADDKVIQGIRDIKSKLENRVASPNLSTPIPSATAPGTYSLPDGDTITEEDINYTAQQEGLTPEQVKVKLGVK